MSISKIMDIREFAQEFQDNVRMAVDMSSTDYDQELASAIWEYIEDITIQQLL